MHRIASRPLFLWIILLAAAAQAAEVTVNAARSGEAVQMGVLGPGAMRQWGRHATAFVGRRHFDDPWLLERYFTLTKP